MAARGPMLTEGVRFRLTRRQGDVVPCGGDDVKHGRVRRMASSPAFPGHERTVSVDTAR